MGAKDITDLKNLIEKQISSQYSQALNSITKKEILDQIDKNHEVDLPKNLVDQEILVMTKNLNQEDKDKNKLKNEKVARSRIKLGLLLNEFGEKNNLKVSEEVVLNHLSTLLYLLKYLPCCFESPQLDLAGLNVLQLRLQLNLVR